MRTLTHQVNDETVFVRIVSQPSEAGEFLDWIDGQSLVAVDTETTGLDLFSSSFRVRTVQFGNPREAWVIQVENSPELVEVSRVALTAAPQVVFHNATYDLLALEQGLGIGVDLNKITDTKILAHLVDPREVKEGGKGLSLSDLTRAYVSATVADEVKDSMTVMAKEHKLTKAKLFAEIDIDDPTYLLYAGMDVVLTSRLHKALTPKVPRVSRKLIPFEHKVAWACMALERQGFLLDVEYAERFSAELKRDQAHWENLALTKFGVEKVNSGDQVAAALKELGVKDFEHTPTGKPKVDSVLLESLIKTGTPPQAALANAVLEAKKASKWRTTWVDKFLDNRDEQNYCHAAIQPLRARTARMSITGIPAQTLPSKDWKVRRCFIAEPGNVIISADYQAQELRVLAALSGDRTMIQAFKNGDDLHQITADASGVERSVGKTVNFAYVYGSGPANIAKTCGISVPKAKQVIAGFESAYPGVKRLSDKLQQQARIKGWIETPTGRRIPVDKDRPYAALNYMVQSTSRDITATALVKLYEAGFIQYVRLPIHDEIVASVPAGMAENALKLFKQYMRTEFKGVLVDTDAELYGKSWAGGYITDPELLAQIEKEVP